MGLVTHAQWENLSLAAYAAAAVISVLAVCSAAAPLPQRPGGLRLEAPAGALERWGWYEVRSSAERAKWLGYYVRGKEVGRKPLP